MGVCSVVCQQQTKNIVNESAIVTETIKQALQEDTTTSRPIQQEERYLKMETGAIYDGDLVKGIRNGKGRQVWPDGSYYEGDFVNDMADGKGILVNAEGSVYDGEWLEDKASGFGKYQSHDGLYYEGQWLEDKQHGIGKEINQRNECYEGEFFRGAKQGLGKLSLNAEEFYEGEFQNGVMHGKGTYTWKDKKSYTGEWKEGQMDGFGMMKWEDGRYYEGNFSKGKQHGEGTFVWKGKKYVGAWVNGYQEGKEPIIISKGRVEWEFGRMGREQNGLMIQVVGIVLNKHFEFIFIIKYYEFTSIHKQCDNNQSGDSQIYDLFSVFNGFGTYVNANGRLRYNEYISLKFDVFRNLKCVQVQQSDSILNVELGGQIVVSWLFIEQQFYGDVQQVDTRDFP